MHNLSHIFTCVLHTYGVITFMYACMLLAIYSMLLYCLIIHASMLCICYNYIQIFLVYGCMLYYMKCLYHYKLLVLCWHKCHSKTGPMDQLELLGFCEGMLLVLTSSHHPSKMASSGLWENVLLYNITCYRWCACSAVHLTFFSVLGLEFWGCE